MFPTLERTLLEVSARCQNIVALEALLETLKPPVHPFLSYTSSANNGRPPNSAYNDDDKVPPGESDATGSHHPSPNDSNSHKNNLLQALLQALDTSSLPSYFWRSLASSLSPRVQDIVNRGGVSARTLRSNRDRLREELRECVLRGSQLPAGASGGNIGSNRGRTTALSLQMPVVVGNWEREAAVMVSSIVGVLGR
jgi:hypothetical protein